ncbi:MAG: sugar phosphate isomerase/epimerase family protein [Anaerobacillus sp.]|uniref:sugar phosphate isomerase/epimerase family protein n=1 Tax=Anaerobacillus sp. TaxID=1872506 RepID=UPI00391AE468
MRLGGPVYIEKIDPATWIYALKQEGYNTAVCPITYEVDESLVKNFRNAAESSDIIIAEVGAWSNPISSDEEVRRLALEYCKNQLDLAERIGARCCVNIAGSRAEQWDGPHQENFST